MIQKFVCNRGNPIQYFVQPRISCTNLYAREEILFKIRPKPRTKSHKMRPIPGTSGIRNKTSQKAKKDDPLRGNLLSTMETLKQICCAQSKS